jgi:hypothetical protein
MSNQNLSTPPATPTPPVDQDWRAERRARRHDQPWIGGLILIALGVIFLLQNMSGFQFRNWWALFILIPAFGSLATAWSLSRQAGRFNRPARGALFSGLVLLAITAVFLFEVNLNWNLVWPVVLIVIGLSMLINFMLPD